MERHPVAEVKVTFCRTIEMLVGFIKNHCKGLHLQHTENAFQCQLHRTVLRED